LLILNFPQQVTFEDYYRQQLDQQLKPMGLNLDDLLLQSQNEESSAGGPLG
jgi:hypothetical protein